MSRTILVIVFFLGIFRSYSQDPGAATWRHIDTSIAKKKNILDVYDLVQQLKHKAFTEKKYFNVARCYYYQIAKQRILQDAFR